MCFCRLPSVAHDYGTSGVACGRPAVPVGNAADGEDTLINIVLQRLHVALAHLRGQIFRIRTFRQTQRFVFLKACISVFVELCADDGEKAVHKLHDVVHAVGLQLIKRIQKRQNRFKYAKFCDVSGVFHNRNRAECVRLRSHVAMHMRKFVVGVFGVHGKHDVPVFLCDVVHCHNRPLPDVVPPHNDRVPRVERVQEKRGFVAGGIPCGVRQGQTVRRSADEQPFCEFHVAGSLACIRHVPI